MFSAKPADPKAYEKLPSEDQLINLLDKVNDEWDAKIGKKLLSV